MFLGFNFRRSPRATRLLLWLLGTVFVLAVIHLCLQYLNLSVYNEKNGRIFEFSNRFDFDDESSVPTWFSQLIFLAISASALLARSLESGAIRRKLWGLITALGILLSLDEVAGIHEQVLQTLHLILFQETAPTIFANAWLVILPFVLAAVGWLAYQMIKQFPRRTVAIFIVGTVVFLIGAIAVDIITRSAPVYSFQSQGISVAIEESLELIGSTLILFSIVQYIELNYSPRLAKVLKQLKTNK